MRIKSISLENIRSYKNQEINFTEGSTLLSGDIGCGKTSVLLGIEFALFGLQPGKKGSALLRNGEEFGKVKINFEVDGNEIIVERTLKRGKSISQDYCSIEINGEKKELSVTELKGKILDILKYPSEFAKKQNILYKFTVYTPQEEMKEIILEDPNARINTLRHVFGIDKYKTILENVSILNSKLREEKRLREGMTLNLEGNKSALVSKEEELVQKRVEVSSMEIELSKRKEKREFVKKEKEDIFVKINERNKFQQEVEKTKIMIDNKNETIFSNNKTIEILKNQIFEMRSLNFEESKLFSLESEISLKLKEKEKFNQKILEVNSRINSLLLKLDDDKKLESKISNLEICPTCLQNVDAIYRANVLNKVHNSQSQIKLELEELEREKIDFNIKIKESSESISKKEKELTDLKILKMKLQGIAEKEKQMNEIEKSNELLLKDIQILKQHNEILMKSVIELSKFENLFELKQKELDDAVREERIVDIKVAELKKEIEVFMIQIENMKKEIEAGEKTLGELNYIVKLENWISKQFVPLISFVEKNVMAKLKKEFSKLFAEWFYILVSDNFNVRLSDDFTPIIEHRDYELDYAYLSGGERTAIALAYRLALNQVINSMMSKIKTQDLVILDEPTDGFSEQQLDKMRDVLQQLNIKQLIIVSHEQKIESFVENVIKFKKDNGITRIESQINS